MNELLSELQAELGPANVLLTPDIPARYTHDWSAERAETPAAVVRPASTKEVSRVLALCNRHGQPVVVQGGLTGLCGGAIPRPGELALSLERLCGIEELDRDAMTMTVKAGTPLEAVQQAAADAGLAFPLDLGARGSCHIGGNIATNAGGNQVLRFGMTRNLVLGLEAVLADGTVVSSLNKMLKNNAGYDLKQLFIGTEGTLGVVTRAVLRLFPSATSLHSALLALDSCEQLIALLHHLGAGLGGALSAFEAMWESYFHYVVDHVEKCRSPFGRPHPIYLLVEMEGSDPARDREKFESVLGEALENGLIADAALANSQRERADFWQIRDGVAEIKPLLRDCANFDVSVPISAMPAFLQEVDRDLNARFPGLTKLVFGHVADSNLHVLCATGRREDVEPIYRVMYEAVGRHQGSISAEHGIGTQKIAFLGRSRNAEEIALMRRLKLALDPRGILNPGRVVGEMDLAHDLESANPSQSAARGG